jgi:hypothetical protein
MDRRGNRFSRIALRLAPFVAGLPALDAAAASLDLPSLTLSTGSAWGGFAIAIAIVIVALLWHVVDEDADEDGRHLSRLSDAPRRARRGEHRDHDRRAA